MDIMNSIMKCLKCEFEEVLVQGTSSYLDLEEKELVSVLEIYGICPICGTYVGNRFFFNLDKDRKENISEGEAKEFMEEDIF